MRTRTISRPRTFVLLALAALVGATVAVLPALAAAPSEVKLEVNNNCVDPDWPCWATPGSGSPASTIKIATGGEVAFTDHATTAAAVVWLGSAPACTGVPTSAMTGWEGKCKFEAPGTYRFESSTLWPEYTKYEVVVEGAATGTTPTTPTSPGGGGGTTTSPSSPAGGGSGSGAALASPLQGSASEAVELARAQHGSSVRGSVKISQAGVGGRLEVDLLASGASLAKAGHSPQARVGRLVRSSLYVGTTSFTVPLNVKGKAALRHRHRLALTVKITLTPLHGAAVTVTRGVVVRA